MEFVSDALVTERIPLPRPPLPPLENFLQRLQGDKEITVSEHLFLSRQVGNTNGEAETRDALISKLNKLQDASDGKQRTQALNDLKTLVASLKPPSRRRPWMRRNRGDDEGATKSSN